MLLQMFIIPMHFAKNEGLMYVAFFEAFNKCTISSTTPQSVTRSTRFISSSPVLFNYQNNYSEEAFNSRFVGWNF